jgi:esterase/lipase
MRGKVLVDLRNVYDRAEAERAGLTYFGVGRGAFRSTTPSEWIECIRNGFSSRVGSLHARSNPRIVVVGLGYVGLPLAVALARKFEVDRLRHR